MSSGFAGSTVMEKTSVSSTMPLLMSDQFLPPSSVRHAWRQVPTKIR